MTLKISFPVFFLKYLKMCGIKKVSWISPIISGVIFLFLTTDCKKDELPALTTNTITDITATTAKGGGTITSDGRAAITARGVCWSTAVNPTTAGSKTIDGTGTGEFISSITGLTAGTAYHVRAYATNSVGTAYGEDISFSASGKVPESVTQPATNISSTGARLNGTVNANDLSTTVTFEYGATTSYGSTITAAQSPVTGNTTVSVSTDISGLTPVTTYHFRIRTENSLGIVYGNDLTFKSTPELPVVTTTPVSCITRTTAQSGGNITSDGGGSITEKGVCWNTQGNPTVLNEKTNDGNGIGSFVSSISGLEMNTTYYFRAYATNSAGTTYGSQESFTTAIINFNPALTYGSVTDIEGNVYKTIQIGSQTWMAENLRTTRYNNGDLIGTTSPDTLDISGETEPKYQWAYDGAECSVDIFGRLYTWYAITDTRGVCPIGWHVPAIEEWVTLYYPYRVGSGEIAGAELMEAGTTHWNRSDITGTNETGFTALPGGFRIFGGTFMNNNQSVNYYNSYYWSSTGFHPFDLPPSSEAFFYPIPITALFNRNPQQQDKNKSDGLSIRCIKDTN
jgi:uncharacterized protein (TIGR02145 family)